MKVLDVYNPINSNRSVEYKRYDKLLYKFKKMKNIEQTANDYASQWQTPDTGIFIINEVQGISYKSFLDGYHKAKEWISVHDKLPSTNRDVLVKIEETGVMYVTFYRHAKHEWALKISEDWTHWRDID